jgi:hypothetical protein
MKVGTAIVHAADVPAAEAEDAEGVVNGSDRAAISRPDLGINRRW